MRWSLFFSIMLFVILLFSSVFEYFGLTIPFLNIFPSLVSSSTGFLSVLCLIAIFSTYIKYRNEKSDAVVPVIFYILDFAIINKLYLNTTWTTIIKWVEETFASMKSWNWSNITLTGFCLVIAIGMFIWGINIWKKGTAPKKKHTMTAADTRVVLSESNQETVRSDTSANSSCPPVQNEDISAGTPSLAYGLICFLLIIPAVSFVQFIFYRVFHLDFNMPDNLSNVLDILAYLGTICIGLIVALLLWIAKKTITPANVEHVRLPAVLALIGEIIIFFLFFFQADLIDEDFLNSFLNTITNNTLASIIVIPIVIFAILDVGISLFINIFFGGTSADSKAWRDEAHEKIDEIQRRIVMFVLNVFLGILGLLLFIPDFFNEIGDVLLSKQDIFPSYDKKDSKHPSPSSPSDSPAPVENSEISSPK